MDDMEKSRIRLTHWIDHNVDHLKGYEEVAHLLEHTGQQEAALRIRQGIRLIEQANDEFRAALTLVPSTGEPHREQVHGHHHHNGRHCGFHHHGHEHKKET